MTPLAKCECTSEIGTSPLPGIMRNSLSILALAVVATTSLHAQTVDPSADMRWRQIGPLRAGRARSIVGVPSQRNVFYAGYDNGGVWRTTDYGSNWVPIFDAQPTGSIGAIAVALSDPNTIYVGTGAGIIRPDLAVGDGMYKSTDGGATWTHLGLRESQMIAYIDVDPTNPNRLFVAVLGHPYGPSPERGIFRSTDGGKTFEKVLFKDDYTSGADVRIDPNSPNIVYATLWQQQQSFIEGQGFGGTSGGVFKSTDGGTTWKPLTDGLPPVIQANLAIAPSNTRVLYATVAGASQNNNVTGTVGLYKSTDAGEHWALANTAPNADTRALGRIGGGDLPTINVDPSNENVIYTASTVMWRSEDAGKNWTAVRGAPGGDDYQRIWINPNDSKILAVVADQGAVISANRGESWSNWYTQATAAMYHVTTDNSFPYRVCGGQQDSGSACVESRSMDGQITFHDWHPVNIQEYGMAAPDPKNPDNVFGSARNTVSLYDRKTSQTRNVGPSAEMRTPDFNRNVRTMPLIWSPVDNKTLFYASNAVWKTTDRGNSWTRISGDLARASWTVPPTTGKYGATVTATPQGSITAVSPSPKSVSVLWAGTDDGNVQVTMDGGKTWKNVTPTSIKPWTRIFNIDAGHFDQGTAYIAANTLRIDDLNPHFYRTHDGGKSWTEINTGITPGAVVNSIREDPRQKGLLYGGTDTQVWVSYDDGDHWESLRINMPAISVRDVTVKDDESCMCADLVIGTHGRGFWILDDLTPLRQAAAIRQASATRTSYLVRPVTALRIRHATNEPTPWPPEMPAGQNPPVYGILDYFVGATSTSPVLLDILDGKGKLVRHYTSADTLPNPDAGVDPVAYNKICQRTPTAPHCAFPLYWAAPTDGVRSTAGMHRFSWDLHYDPIVVEGTPPGEPAQGAVPHRTLTAVNSPWAPPGQYTVRLTVDGKQYSQPITVKLDPRVKTSVVALKTLETTTKALYDEAAAVHEAYLSGRALSAKLANDAGADETALRARVDSAAPAPVRGGGRGFGGGGGRGGAGGLPQSNLNTAWSGLMAAAMAMQNADAQPTAGDLAGAARARAQAKDAMTKWNELRGKALDAVNAKRRAAGKSVITYSVTADLRKAELGERAAALTQVP